MKNTYLVFDIETRPLPLETIKARGLMPSFKPPANIKDPEKIKAREAEHEADVMEKAALDPLLSTVCAVGVIYGDGEMFEWVADQPSTTAFRSEELQLKWIWHRISHCLNDQGHIVGFNTHGFDLPYLINRSWILDVPICESVLKGKWWSEFSIDLADKWRVGRKDSYVSLDRLARAMNVGQKSGNGKDFAALLDTDFGKAIDYLRNDLTLTLKIAQRMGVIDL
jgi:hypothetical protein